MRTTNNMNNEIIINNCSESVVDTKMENALNAFGINNVNQKNDNLPADIKDALTFAPSKTGTSTGNTLDLWCSAGNDARYIFVAIENKAKDTDLIKTDADGKIDESKGARKKYAVNGALYYTSEILKRTDRKEMIFIGATENYLEAYYVAKSNGMIPKKINAMSWTDLALLKSKNANKLFNVIDNLYLTDDEIAARNDKVEADFEAAVKEIHDSIYGDADLKTALGTNDKLYLFCGLIMAGLHCDGLPNFTKDDLKCSPSENDNDGARILRRIEDFLTMKHCPAERIDGIKNLVSPIFKNRSLWMPKNGMTTLKRLFNDVKEKAVRIIEGPYHIDFTGRIMNSLNDWADLENDKKNDVVLTPRYVADLMARMARTNKDSYVWDRTMGSGSFLVKALEIMEADAKTSVTDSDALSAKIDHIREKQVLGIEILGNVYILAVLNMILMGNVGANIMNKDANDYTLDNTKFPANVFLLNPPYSGKDNNGNNDNGFGFACKGMSQMLNGYACILIQESTGSGKGGSSTKKALEMNTLRASIKMPGDLFCGKAGVQTDIYVFEIGRPHETDDIVTFIDFSEDGYKRSARKKSDQSVNLKDVDNAKARYAEVANIVLGKKTETSYYTEANGKVIKDSISLNGDDWTFAQHIKTDTAVSDDDFAVASREYTAYSFASMLR